MTGGHIGDTDGEHSVYFFTKDGRCTPVRRWIGIEEAAKAAHRYCTSPHATRGQIVRVIITDGGDCTNFEWKYGEGITFPPRMKGRMI